MVVIGIDLGGTKIQGARVDLDGDDHEVAADARVDTPTGGPDTVVAAIAALIDDLGGAAGLDGVGVGAPGAVDPSTGAVGPAPNLAGWDEPVPLAALVREAVGDVDVRVDNDVNVGTIAEHRLGAGRDASDFLGLFVGTGVGGGLVLDGELRRGPNGLAGEIGHTVVELDGRMCGCGHAGHLESYAGRAGMEAEARRRHAAGEETALVELAGDGPMKSGTFRKALAAGDPVAMELIDQAVAALGAAVASAVALVDVSLVVAGGGLPEKLGAAFVGRVEEAARSRLFVPSSPLRVVPAELGDLGGALGAALLLRR
jgi:glucokinase